MRSIVLAAALAFFAGPVSARSASVNNPGFKVPVYFCCTPPGCYYAITPCAIVFNLCTPGVASSVDVALETALRPEEY